MSHLIWFTIIQRWVNTINREANKKRQNGRNGVNEVDLKENNNNNEDNYSRINKTITINVSIKSSLEA